MKILLMNSKQVKIIPVIGIIFFFFFLIIIPMAFGYNTHFTGRELLKNSDEYYMFYHSKEYPRLEKNTYEETIKIINKEKVRTPIIETIETVEKHSLQTITDGIMDSAWPMFGHDIRHTGRSHYGPTGNTPVLKWKFTMNGYVVSSPAIDKEGTIYIGGISDRCLFAINPDGTEKWRGETYDKIRSSPAIGKDGTVYVGDCDGYLYAFDSNGSLIWKCRCGGGWVRSSPTIGDDGTIYVGATNNRFYAVNPNGTIKWSYETGFKIYSSAAIDDNGIIYIGSHDDYLYAFYPNGTVKWKYKANGEVKCPPTIGDDGTIYVGSWGSELNAVNPNGTRKWQFYSGDAVETSPAIAPDGTIYFGSYNGLFFSISPKGTENWRFRAGSGGSDGWVISSPAIDKNGIIYVGSLNGGLFALNPDGTLRWKYDTGGSIETSPAIAEDGTIYFGADFYATSKAYLYAINVVEGHNPDKPTLSGPPSGIIDVEYIYTAHTTDADGENVSFRFDWGDGSKSGWTEYIPSGETVNVSNIWTEKGTYNVTVIAKDIYGHESEVSDPLSVSMPKNKIISSPFIQFLENHPRLFPILRHILKL